MASAPPRKPAPRRRPAPPERPPGRETLHVLLDKVLDRSPEAERQIHALLLRLADGMRHPEAQMTMRTLAAGKSLIDLFAELRGGRNRRPT